VVLGIQRFHLFQTAGRLPSGHLHTTGVSHALTPFSLIRRKVKLFFTLREGSGELSCSAVTHNLPHVRSFMGSRAEETVWLVLLVLLTVASN
jgi:hypothetical protein